MVIGASTRIERQIGNPVAAVAQLVERILGKDEVTSSNLVSSFVGDRGAKAKSKSPTSDCPCLAGRRQLTPERVAI